MPTSGNVAMRAKRPAGAFAVAILGLVWIGCFIFLNDAYQQLSFRVGPGLISYVDIYVGILFVYSFVVYLQRNPGRRIKRILGTLLISFCGLNLVGILLRNPLKDIIGDWKRVFGLFAGVGIALIFRNSRFEPEKIASIVFGLIPLLLCSIAALIRLGAGEDILRTQGLYVSSQVWAPWLPILLCRSSIRQSSAFILPVVALGVLIMVPSLGTRALAFSIAVSFVGFTLWRLRTGDFKNPDSSPYALKIHHSKVDPTVADRDHIDNPRKRGWVLHAKRIRKWEAARYQAALALILGVVFFLALAEIVSLRAHSSYVERFVSRLSPEDPLSKENITVRIEEIKEMVGGMSTVNQIVGKGMGGTYYFRFADVRWVASGLYSTPYLPAPHILIAGLFLKGGWLLFLMGGVLYPLATIIAFLSGLLRKDRVYLVTLAPYDLAILATFAFFYTSCQFDVMTLLSFSLILALKSFAADKTTSTWPNRQYRPPWLGTQS